MLYISFLNLKKFFNTLNKIYCFIDFKTVFCLLYQIKSSMHQLGIITNSTKNQQLGWFHSWNRAVQVETNFSKVSSITILFIFSQLFSKFAAVKRTFWHLFFTWQELLSTFIFSLNFSFCYHTGTVTIRRSTLFSYSFVAHLIGSSIQQALIFQLTN